MYPILFHIGSFAVHTYGVVLMLGALLGLTLAYNNARRANDPQLNPDNVVDAGIVMVISGIIGARLLFVVLDWNGPEGFHNSPGSIFKIWTGGLSFHGGLIGGLLALIVFCAIKKVPLLKLADSCAAPMMLAYAIGRVGCFFNGCCYGAPTQMPWGVRFFDDGQWTPPSHPTQLYSTALSLLFFGFLVWLQNRRTFDGQLASLYILFAAIERFIMEIWRAGTTSGVGPLGLTETQWLCLGMMLIAVAGLAAFSRRSDLQVRRNPISAL